MTSGDRDVYDDELKQKSHDQSSFCLELIFCHSFTCSGSVFQKMLTFVP